MWSICPPPQKKADENTFKNNITLSVDVLEL